MRGSPRDPGLQPERTRLAWRRTTLACTVTAVLAVKAVLHDGRTNPPVVLVSAFCLVLWLAFLAVAQRRIRGLARPAPRVLAPRAAAAAVTCIVALALCATALVV